MSQKLRHTAPRGRRSCRCWNYGKSVFKQSVRLFDLPLIETKRSTDLVESDQLGELPGVHEEMAAQVLKIAVKESLLLVEAKRNDISCVLHGVFQSLFKCQVVLEQRLLVIRQHENQGHIKDILQPLCELERNCVTKVKTTGAGTATCVEEEGLAVLVLGEDLVEVAMAEEEAASEPAMRLLACHLLESLEKRMVNL